MNNQSEVGYCLDDYVREIKQELESILNIVSSDLIEHLQKSSHLHQSILNYGLPLHMKWGGIKNNDHEGILKHILTVISHHEPRIIDPSVCIDHAMPMHDFKLNLCIEGTVFFSKKQSNLFIRSQCFPLDMRFKVL